LPVVRACFLAASGVPNHAAADVIRPRWSLAETSALSLRSTPLRHNNAVIMRILKSARCAVFAAIMPVLLAACATTPKPQLTAADAADVDRITAYLNSVPRFEAHFIQYGSFGPDAGVVWLDRPAGHLRIDYTGA